MMKNVVVVVNSEIYHILHVLMTKAYFRSVLRVLQVDHTK